MNEDFFAHCLHQKLTIFANTFRVMRLLLVATMTCFQHLCLSQSIVDPCFVSIENLGFFSSSDDIINLNKAGLQYYACDMLEWNGEMWVGEYPGMGLKLVPPEGCNNRAIWMGYDWWTAGGEAIAMRLDKPLEVGKKYTFSFTYGSAGNGDLNNFSPIIYTDKYFPTLNHAHRVGRFPKTDDWATHSITFTTTERQRGHDWIILHAYESSGIVLANCKITDPIETELIAQDTTICYGDGITLSAINNVYYSYYWNTEETTPSIHVTEPGEYAVEVTNHKCTGYDTVTVNFEDCTVRLTMPNIFTPNGDDLNASFMPMEYNYLTSGIIRIYNRWGNLIYAGDLFKGWNGKYVETDASAGIYFYEVNFIDRNGNEHKKKGTLTLVR